MAINSRKVAMVGCGFVGSASAFALMQSKLFSEMVLIDADQNRAEGEALDISHGMAFASPMKIYAGTYDDVSVRNCRIANGTADITQKPAMTKAELYRCIETGIGLAKCAKEDRVKLLVTGEMGIGNTTTSSAVASVLLGCDPLLVTGRGAGLSDSGLSRKLEAIKKAIKLHHPDPEDPLSVLSMLGGFDIAGMVGLYLGGALYQVPVLIDGVISAVAALLAVKICPASKKAMLATHVSAEPAGCMILDAIGLEPMITAGMRLGEGTGALCAIPMLDMACSVYQGSTFGELSIEAYEEQGSQL